MCLWLHDTVHGVEGCGLEDKVHRVLLVLLSSLLFSSTHTHAHNNTHMLQLQSAVHAVKEGTAVVIANGLKQGETILDIIKGKPIGTLITCNGHTELAAPLADSLADEGELKGVWRCCAECKWISLSLFLSLSLSLPVNHIAREGSYALQALTSKQVSRSTATTTSVHACTSHDFVQFFE